MDLLLPSTKRKLAKHTLVEGVTLESVLILVATVYKERNCECSFHITVVFEIKNPLRTMLPHMGCELKAISLLNKFNHNLPVFFIYLWLDEILLKPCQNKKDQNIFQVHRFYCLFLSC